MPEDVNLEIVVCAGPHQGAHAEFSRSPILLGRALSNDLPLPNDSTVSGVHAVLQWEDGSWWIDDCNSKNGTFVCGPGGRSRVQALTRLATEDFLIGSTRISLAFGAQANATVVLTNEARELDTKRTEGLRLFATSSGESIRYQLASSDPTVAAYKVARDDSILAEINSRLEGLVALANESPGGSGDRKGPSIGAELSAIGLLTSQRLVPRRIDEKLLAGAGASLFVSHDPALVNVPWELIDCDGEPWCLRFNIGRQVMLEEQSVRIVPRHRAPSLDMLIVSNPTEDLPETDRRVENLVEKITRDFPAVRLSLVSGSRVTRSDVLSRLESADIVYYIGHAKHDSKNSAKSAWLLHDGKITCADFASVSRPPEFVFANACESGKEATWAASRLGLSNYAGLASSFLAAGVTHYLGSVWPIAQAGSDSFASGCLLRLLGGIPIGEAVRLARKDVLRKFGSDNLIWASYVLYGDPSCTFAP